MSDMFRKAVEIVLEREGVLSDDANDNGGLTKYGISKKAYPNLDIRSLTRDQAIAIYKRDYWDANRCGEMPWWAALLVFDTGVNMGQPYAAKLIQKTVMVNPDGKIGPQTLAAVRKTPGRRGIEHFMAARMIRYTELDDWTHFQKGWTRRAFHIAIEAMAAESSPTWQVDQPVTDVEPDTQQVLPFRPDEGEPDNDSGSRSGTGQSGARDPSFDHQR